MTAKSLVTPTIKFFLFVLFLAVCWIVGKSYNIDIDHYRSLFQQYPLMLSGLVFIVLYVVITFFVWFGPKDFFRLTSAILYGPVISTVFVSIAETINAGILFKFSRKMGQEYIKQKFKIRTKDIDRAKKGTSFLWAFAIRSNPFIPMRMSDLTFGVTNISCSKYVLAAFIASPPRILWQQFILAGVGDAVFKDINIVREYLLTNLHIFIMGLIYMLFVFLITIVAIVVHFIKMREEKEEDQHR